MNHLLHLPTIMVIHACSTLISALLIGNLWRQRRQSALLGILTFAAAIGFLGTIMHAMRPLLPFWMSAGVALGAGALALGLFWQAIAVFEGKRPSYLKASAGTLIWFALYLTPVFHSSIMFRTAAIALIMGTYSVLGGREIWLGRLREPLPSRKLAAGVHCARGAVWYSVLLGALLLDPPYKAPGQYADWFVLASLLQALLVMLSIITLLILALERDERKSRLVSERDPLTNLRNRRSFVEQAEALLNRETGPSALLLFDIDHFKQINDTHGHAGGDRVLREFSAMLEGRMQADWLLARIGGEEFACLIPNVGTAHAADIAEAMRRAVERLHATIDGQYVPVAVSIGVAATDEVTPSLDLLLAAADIALYQAKADGRNAVRIHRPGQALHGLFTQDHAAPVAANEVGASRRSSRATRRG
ncbi:MAG: GGDEF domain-containing protein [Rhizobium sp.]|nr:GGDEF domain-containing protein [Rhizobium sp.]